MVGLGISNVYHLGSWPKYRLYVIMSPQSSFARLVAADARLVEAAVSVAGGILKITAQYYELCI